MPESDPLEALRARLALANDELQAASALLRVQSEELRMACALIRIRGRMGRSVKRRQPSVPFVSPRWETH